MKRSISILLVVLSVLLLTACGGEQVLNDLNESTDIENNKTLLNPDTLKENIALLTLDSDVEDDINSMSLEEDKRITQKAEDASITEYDIIIDEKEIRQGLLESTAADKGCEIIELYNTILPDQIEESLIYDRYDVTYNYVIVMGDSINIREKPTVASAVAGTAHNLEKMNLLSKVKGQYLDSFGGNIWYEIAWKDLDVIKTGFIFSDFVDKRTFQIDEMVAVADNLRKATKNYLTAYISNYKDRSGSAPQYNGQDEDEYGTKRFESAPAYKTPDEKSEFRYLPDGALVSLISETDDFFKVKSPYYENEYFVPKKYVSCNDLLEELSQVVVIDVRNQNEIVLRCFMDKWQIVSYTYVTTGVEQGSKYTYPGYYKPIQKRVQFDFKDENDEIVGYAPYAIRFNGSAYIHGIPVNYSVNNGELGDPGMDEYLFTLGTIPRTNKTVRNFTSHAKFLYEWLEIGESAVIILE